MEKILFCIKKDFTNLVTEYTNSIVTKYNLDPQEWQKIWKQVNKESTEPNTSIEKQKDETGNRCQYVFTRKEPIGSVCGVKIKKDTEFCSKHSKRKIQEEVVMDTSIPTPEKRSADKVLRLQSDINRRCLE